jgi:transcriptional regulator with XRE-family HTH domain
MGSISLYGAMGAALKTSTNHNGDKDGLKEIGTVLRRKRQELQLSLKDVANHIMITEAQLRALEEGNWTTLPSQVYARGYLRRYADFLGLDQSSLSTQLHSAMPPLELVKTPVIHKSSVRLGFHPIFMLCLLITFAIATALFYQPSQSSDQPIIKSIPKSLIAYAEAHSMQAVRSIPGCLQQTTSSLWSCYLPLRSVREEAFNPYVQPWSQAHF